MAANPSPSAAPQHQPDPSLDADAFRRLYPAEYHERFLSDGIRHDGRTLGRARATTIVLGTISTADGSALVKLGNTTVIAGVRLSLQRPPEATPDRGSLAVTVELAQFARGSWPPGRKSELLDTARGFIADALLTTLPRGAPPALSLQQLCVAEGKAAWAASLDVYVLNADGSVLDAALLAAVSALLSTTLPPTITTPEGEVRRHKQQQQPARLPGGGDGAGAAQPMDCSTSDAAPASAEQAGRAVTLDRIPLALSCGIYKGWVLVDPDDQEEDLAKGAVQPVVDQHGHVYGIWSAGVHYTRMQLLQCVESAKLRHREVSELLQQAVQQFAEKQAMVRILEARVPASRQALVLECLQGDACRLQNLTTTNDGIVATLSVYIRDEEVGVVMHELDKIGVGTAYGKVAVLPTSFVKPIPKTEDRYIHNLVTHESWRLKHRLCIEEMYENVKGGADLSFDFCALVVVAAWIAAVGLATDNSVMIVASMLVSPLMGPILAFCFGTSVQDWKLVKQGVMVELAGLFITFIVGFVAGLIAAGWEGVPTGNAWPTDEMSSRGNPRNLITGVLFAVPSGGGVALSATAGGPTAIVGVAIAASLLPPIVNVGMNLAFAIAGAARLGWDQQEFYNIAAISLALYGVNIFCIYFVCLLWFWIKDVKDVRKQLSTYRDLPPVHAAVSTDVDEKERLVSGSGAKPASSMALSPTSAEDDDDTPEEEDDGGRVAITMSKLEIVKKTAGLWRAKVKSGDKAINSAISTPEPLPSQQSRSLATLPPNAASSQSTFTVFKGSA